MVDRFWFEGWSPAVVGLDAGDSSVGDLFAENNGDLLIHTWEDYQHFKEQVRSKNVIICCRELKMKHYSQKNYIEIIKIFELSHPLMWVGYDDSFERNIENFDILLFAKPNGLGCSII